MRTMNDVNQKAYDELCKGIQSYVNKVVSKSKYDITKTGVVKGITDGGYTVDIDNATYENVKTIGGSCLVNETVTILIPQGNYSNMKILKGGNGSGGSIGSGVSSVNHKVGDVILTVEDLDIAIETSDIDFSNYFE